VAEAALQSAVLALRPAVSWLDQKRPRNVPVRTLPIPKEDPPQSSPSHISIDEIWRERYGLVRRHPGAHTSRGVALRIREVSLSYRQAGVRGCVSGLKRDCFAVHANSAPKVINVPAKEE